MIPAANYQNNKKGKTDQASFKFVFHPNWIKKHAMLSSVENSKPIKIKCHNEEIDELLKLPVCSQERGKSKDETLDDIDRNIRKRELEEQQKSAQQNQESKVKQKRKEDCQARKKKNALLRNRLEKELSRNLLKAAFQKNLSFLQSIRDGVIKSERHTAFHKSESSRQRLFYMMITDPYTDEQVNWTVDEMSKVWMRSKKEHMDNQDYIWKVLLPEFFIKVYCDWFNVDKVEAEKMMKETPLHKKDDSSQGESDEAGDMVA